MATKLDVTTGAEEKLTHLPGPNGDLYSWCARSPETTAGVLICSSVLGEFATNYHRERALSLELLSRGIGVIRFHYAGEGNSFGDRAHMTYESMMVDAETVLGSADSLGFESVGFLGTRLGALVASTLAGRVPGAPLAFWEPAVEPLSFIDDARRASKMSLLVQSGVSDLSNWRSDLERNGRIDLLGHDIYLPLIESLENLTILELVGDEYHPMMIAGLGNRQARLETFAEELKAMGNQVSLSQFQAMESSWLGGDSVVPAHDLIKFTANWFGQHLVERPSI